MAPGMAAGMAAGIASTMNKVATLGLAPIVFGPIMNTTASALANWWRTHPADANSADSSMLDRETG